MITIRGRDLNRLTAEAQKSERLRNNKNYHSDFRDPINRLLNAVEPETYVRPHCHQLPDKTEVFIILRGRAAVFEFDNTGLITESIVLDPKKGHYAVEIPPRIWHSIVSLEPGTVMYEVKNGPYDPDNDKRFAPWAPAEDDPKRKKEAYMHTLLSHINNRS